MEKVQLKNICRPKQWKTLTGKNLVPDGKYPVYGANGIIGYYNDYNHENETLMIGCRGTCGALNISQPFSYINGNAMALDDLVDDIDIRYLYYALMGRGFQDVISGAVQPQIIRADLEKMEVWIGNKKEQKEIVDVFSKLDAVLSHRKREIQYLDDLIKARFVEMFGDPVSNPYKLPTVLLGELSELITKGASPSWQGFNYTDDPSQTLFLTSENVKNGYIDLSSPKYIEDKFNTKQKRSIVHKGDFLINIVGASIGRAAQFNLNCKANMNQAAALVRINDNRIRDKYLLTYLNSDKAQLMYDSMKSDTGRANLSLKDISELSILLPSIEEQLIFEKVVAQIDKSKLLSGCRLFHSWAPENRDKPKHVGVPRRRTKVLRGCRRQQ